MERDKAHESNSFGKRSLTSCGWKVYGATVCDLDTARLIELRKVGVVTVRKSRSANGGIGFGEPRSPFFPRALGEVSNNTGRRLMSSDYTIDSPIQRRMGNRTAQKVVAVGNTVTTCFNSVTHPRE